jgi:hypothetical protein
MDSNVAFSTISMPLLTISVPQLAISMLRCFSVLYNQTGQHNARTPPLNVVNIRSTTKTLENRVRIGTISLEMWFHTPDSGQIAARRVAIGITIRKSRLNEAAQHSASPLEFW